jgi:EAL domain-containing protein (putative c-di-GMP-specific phosphodiesterase class I)
MGAVVESWVREAVDKGLPESQLELHFQPIVRLDGSGVHGAETFLRWRHPERGLVRPDQWLPYATRSGAGVALCTAVLPAWAAYARQLPGLVLSFNVTGQDLSDVRFMALVLGLGAEGGAGMALEVSQLQFHPGAGRAVAPEWGWLELADLDARLTSVRAVGFTVWLDDFGEAVDDETAAVGSSVDVVKLDKSLLGWDRPRLVALIGRLHEHGKVALVEGVESEAHERLAAEVGVDLSQGFLYARPLSGRQFAEYLENGAPAAP